MPVLYGKRERYVNIHTYIYHTYIHILTHIYIYTYIHIFTDTPSRVHTTGDWSGACPVRKEREICKHTHIRIRTG